MAGVIDMKASRLSILIVSFSLMLIFAGCGSGGGGGGSSDGSSGFLYMDIADSKPMLAVQGLTNL